MDLFLDFLLALYLLVILQSCCLGASVNENIFLLAQVILDVITSDFHLLVAHKSLKIDKIQLTRFMKMGCLRSSDVMKLDTFFNVLVQIVS